MHECLLRCGYAFLRVLMRRQANFALKSPEGAQYLSEGCSPSLFYASARPICNSSDYPNFDCVCPRLTFLVPQSLASIVALSVLCVAVYLKRS